MGLFSLYCFPFNIPSFILFSTASVLPYCEKQMLHLGSAREKIGNITTGYNYLLYLWLKEVFLLATYILTNKTRETSLPDFAVWEMNKRMFRPYLKRIFLPSRKCLHVKSSQQSSSCQTAHLYSVSDSYLERCRCTAANSLAHSAVRVQPPLPHH